MLEEARFECLDNSISKASSPYSTNEFETHEKLVEGCVQ